MGSACFCEGTLSPTDFEVAARVLSEKWEECNPALPPWTWKHRPKLPWDPHRVEGYLSLESLYLLKLCEQYRIEGSELVSGKEELVDDATLKLDDQSVILSCRCQPEIQNCDNGAHIYDFHIVYNASYKVPVLYFRGCHIDGQPLERDDIEKDLPPYSLKLLKGSKWAFMTQEDHPYLNRPWYTLHPCGTADWMELLFLGGESSISANAKDVMIQQYLISWLSVVGQAVGLNVPVEMLCKSLQINLSTSTCTN